jgi:peptidoglycan/xylan/chitin deacetylase (PgdA/CDA1 family)
MKKRTVLGIYLLGLSFLIGCGGKVENKIQQSIEDNQSAKTIVEWDSSAGHPEVIFGEWRNQAAESESEKEKLMSEVCEKLIGLSGQSLSIFEEEIRKESNQFFISGCKEALLQRLDEYFAAERSQLAVQVNSLRSQRSSNNFKFQDNVQHRDYSNGYLAYSGDLARKEIILTFDDGPSDSYTRSILRSLKEVNAKAHFFELGKAVRSNPEITKLVAADGHMIGSHSITHSCIGNLKECGRANGGHQYTFDAAVAEIRGGHQAVFDVLGWVDPIFRFPYGASAPNLRNFLKASSTGEFYWNIDSEDWRAQSNSHLIKKTLAQVEARGLGIVLFHDIQRRTAEILPEFLRELYTRGYSVVLLQSSDPKLKYNSKLVRKKLP